MDVKLAFYKELGGLIKPEAIFASNTSSLQITEMALASGRPDRYRVQVHALKMYISLWV